MAESCHKPTWTLHHTHTPRLLNSTPSKNDTIPHTLDYFDIKPTHRKTEELGQRPRKTQPSDPNSHLMRVTMPPPSAAAATCCTTKHQGARSRPAGDAQPRLPTTQERTRTTPNKTLGCLQRKRAPPKIPTAVRKAERHNHDKEVNSPHPQKNDKKKEMAQKILREESRGPANPKSNGV